MKPRNPNSKEKINSSSMADIAFLLLIFFLVSTTMVQDKGLDLKLPPYREEKTVAPIKERNLFKILINSRNEFLVENEIRFDLTGLKEEIKNFILNSERDPGLAERPDKAVVSLKTSRGTKYEVFIDALDEIKGAYYEIYAQRVHLSAEEYRNLNPEDPGDRTLYLKGKDGIPMNISIAEPTD